MFIICDQNNVVQDIATEEANLSRGYGFTGYKLWTDAKAQDIQIGDTYKAGVLTENQQRRQEQLERQQNESKIRKKIRAIAITELKAAGELPVDYE